MPGRAPYVGEMMRTAPGGPAPAGSLVAIVDDEQLVRSATSSLLRSLGFECRMFESAEALLAEDFCSFACVLSDIQMPGMSGVALAQRIVKRSDHPPVVLMSAYPNEQALDLRDRRVIVALLDKPLDSDLLHATIADAVRDARINAR
jgi:FixJ family two-component response regulator